MSVSDRIRVVMSITSDLIKTALAPLAICIILYSFKTPDYFNLLWVTAYESLILIIQKFRYHYRFELGVTSDIYWSRFSIVLLYSFGIVGLGFYYFIRKGASFEVTVLLHILILVWFYLDDYAEKKASMRKPYGPSEIIEMARKSLIFGTFLLVLLLSLILFIIIPGFRNLKLFG